MLSCLKLTRRPEQQPTSSKFSDCSVILISFHFDLAIFNSPFLFTDHNNAGWTVQAKKLLIMPCIVMYTWSHAHCILLCTHGHTHTVYFYVHMATRTLYIVMYTWPHAHCIHPESSDPGRPSRYGGSWRSSLGGRSKLLMLCVVSFLLRRPYVVWTYGLRMTFTLRIMTSQHGLGGFVPAGLVVCKLPLQVLSS